MLIFIRFSFGKKSHANCVCFAPLGDFIATGSVDGLVELWDFIKGKHETERFKFQSNENMNFISHNSPIMSICFSVDSELLAGKKKNIYI